LGYIDWFEKHYKKHKKIVDKLLQQNYTKEMIIDYFDYDNMVKKEIDFCPLYKDNKKCHNMQELNCYLCACPNFRFNDNGIKKVDDVTLFSICNINSKDGKQSRYGEKIHQNCIDCTIPHHKKYISEHFHYDWKTIMQKCRV